MRFLRVTYALVLFGAACSSGPADTWENSVSHTDQPSTIAFCDAYAVIEQKCVRCHSDPPKNGAPFALDSYEATQAPSPSSKDPDRIRADRMLKAVESGFMPYTSLLLDPPVEPLTCEERTTLLEWLRNGSPPPADSENPCGDEPPRLLECADDGAGAGDG
jgi:uncharacterized membrane protein